MDHAPVGRLSSGAPRWPNAIVGSISHAAGRAVALIGAQDAWRAIGIDVESVEGWFPGLGDEIATASEVAWLAGMDTERRKRCEVALFSAKEAYYKALSAPEYVGFDVVEMRPVRGGFAATALRPLGPKFASGSVHMVSIQWVDEVVLASLLVARRHGGDRPGSSTGSSSPRA